MSKLSNEELKKIRKGEESFNNNGEHMIIKEYIDRMHIIVQFDDGYETITQYGAFIDGRVKNRNTKMVFGVGSIGNLKAKDEHNNITKEYNLWHMMLQRAFSDKIKKEHTTYNDVSCCNEWLYYPNFYEWVHSQDNWDILTKSNIRFDLDKDILVKGNKIYSPTTTCLVPNNINKLFTKRDSNRGKYPIGVYYRKNENRFCAQCSNPQIGKQVCCGYYSSAEDAFYKGYKPYKEKLIKIIAEEEYRKGTITKKCFDAMCCYEVEITD